MKVVHVLKDPYDVNVMRPSEWGNPYTVVNHGQGGACAKFETMVRDDPEYRRRARYRLAGLTLGCCCAPKGGADVDGPTICHAQILARAARGDYEL
jgi:hypothetical protein